MNALPLALVITVALSVLGCAIVFCRIASRAAVGWKWTLAACCILAVMGSMAVTEVGVPSAGPQRGKHGSLMLGLGVTRHPKPAQVLQFALPLAVCGMTFALQQAQQRRRSLLA